MNEIIVHQMDDGIDGNLTYLGDGIVLPADAERIENVPSKLRMANCTSASGEAAAITL